VPNSKQGKSLSRADLDGLSPVTVGQTTFSYSDLAYKYKETWNSDSKCSYSVEQSPRLKTVKFHCINLALESQTKSPVPIMATIDGEFQCGRIK
jgi:hypothetical protein